jgi:hypothetical protein
MRKILVFLLLPFLVIFASNTQKGQEPHSNLLKEFEKTFTFHKKEIGNGTIVYKGVELKEGLILLKVKDIFFYTNTPLLVGKADNLTYTDIGFNALYTAERVKFAADRGKIFSVVENAELTDRVYKLVFPQIINILLWQPNRFFYQSQGEVLYEKGSQKIKDYIHIQSEVQFQPQAKTVILNLTAGDNLFLKLESSIKVSNVSPEVIEVIKQLKNKRENKDLEKKADELIFNAVPEEFEIAIKLHPYALKIIKSNSEIKNEIESLKEELKNIPENSLERKILNVILNLFDGKSDTAVIKIRNTAGLTADQIVALFALMSMAKTEEQAIKLIEPYFDIKIVDY